MLIGTERKVGYDLPKISACLIVKNEEKRIRSCLESIEDAVNEIIVIDGFSTDKTAEICKEFTDKVYQHEWRGSFAKEINFAISKASYEWILSIDADERLSKKLSEKLDKIVKIGEEKAISLFQVPRRIFIKGKGKMRSWIERRGAPRLFKKDVVIWEGKVHESPTIEGKRAVLPKEYYLIHYSSRYHSSPSQVLNKNLRFIKLDLRQKEKIHSTFFYLLKALSAIPLEILRRFFLMGEILSGSLGFHRALWKGTYKFTLHFLTAFLDKEHNYLTGHWIFRFLVLLFTIEQAIWHLAKSPLVD